MKNSGINKQNVSVVIPTFNGRELLKRNLPRVLAAVGSTDEVIVIDDGSTDETLVYLREKFPRVKTAPIKHQGFGPAVDSGMKLAATDWVLVLNNDVVPADNCLAELERAADSDIFALSAVQRLKGLGGKLGGAPIGRFHRGLIGHDSYFEYRSVPQAPFEILYANLGAALVNRQKWLSLGGSSRIFAPTYYWDDAALGLEAWARGWRCLCVPTARVIHEHEATINKLFDLATKDKLSFRNQLIFNWLNLSGGQFWLKHWLWLPIRIIFGGANHFLGFFSALFAWPAIRRLRKKTTPLNLEQFFARWQAEYQWTDQTRHSRS